MTPEEVLDQLDRDVDALRRRGLVAQAELAGQIAEDFREAMTPLALVHESIALARTGKPRRWLRDRFDGWRAVGAAAEREGARWYRLCVLPTRMGYEEGRALAVDALKAKEAA